MKKRLLFVCLGNICRSPMAEGIFLHLAKARGIADRFEVDSAGTGNWHCGEPPDARATETARKRGVHLPSVCRQVAAMDFGHYDLILPMDRANREALLALCPPEHRAKVRLMREFDREAAPGSDPEVPDPYFGDVHGFDRVYDMLHRSCDRLLDHLEQDLAGRGTGKGA